eukprot:4750757-Pyramimonas_sp.AAC.1
MLRLRHRCRGWTTPAAKHQLDRLRRGRPPKPGKAKWPDGANAKPELPRRPRGGSSVRAAARGAGLAKRK